MIINCECGKKKFNIDNSLIPTEGRLLKCGSCSKIWHYKHIIDTKNDEELEVKINENVIKNEVQSDETLNDENFTDINEVLSEENTDDDKDEENNLKEEKGNEEKQGKIRTVLVYFIVVIISLLGIIFLLDTFKSYLISVFPTITPFLDSFYETLLDFKLFIKDLVN